MPVLIAIIATLLVIMILRLVYGLGREDMARKMEKHINEHSNCSYHTCLNKSDNCPKV
jgi:hypothetical protein